MVCDVVLFCCVDQESFLLTPRLNERFYARAFSDVSYDFFESLCSFVKPLKDFTMSIGTKVRRQELRRKRGIEVGIGAELFIR